MKRMKPHFNIAALRFLRGLARNNDREWFAARKTLYASEVQAPFLAIVEAVSQAMTEFAPSHLRPANKVVLRIYRDTRFSADKRPFKQHVAAWWGPGGAEKTSGAGFYLHISGKEVVVAAGIFMPTPEQLAALRGFIGENGDALQSLLSSKTLRTLMPERDDHALTRVPRGYASDHPFAELLRARRIGVSATLPADVATSPALTMEVIKRFRAASTLIEMLNAPLLKRAAKKSRSLF